MIAALQIIDLQVVDESKRFSLANDIASTITQIIQSKGRCTPKDLHDQGYMPKEVVKHWHIAHSIASLAVRCMP